MRTTLLIYLLFFLIGSLAIAPFEARAAICVTPGLPEITYPSEKECSDKCPDGACRSDNTTNTTCQPGQFCNPLTSQSFEALVQSLANWVAAIALPIAAIFIIYSGFLFVTASGNQSKIDAAKTTFYWTIIGTAVVVGAWALATAIVDFAKKL